MLGTPLPPCFHVSGLVVCQAMLLSIVYRSHQDEDTVLLSMVDEI